LKVVNLAVTDNSEASPIDQNGLMAPGHIHDGQSGVTKYTVSIDVDPPVVGPPVREGIQHPVDGVHISPTYTSGYAAHFFTPLLTIAKKENFDFDSI
jgi:hypothetical protein